MKLDDLNEYARKKLVSEPEVLDAWVAARVKRVQSSLEALTLYRERRAYRPAPVEIVEIGAARAGEARVIDPDPPMLRQLFSPPTAVVCIHGEEGSGKSTLACAIARWAMAEDETQRLASHRMIPIFIVQNFTDLRDAVTGRPHQMLVSDETGGLMDGLGEQTRVDLIDNLMAEKRLLVIIDGLSELDPNTRTYVQKIFDQPPCPNALVITSREPPGLEIERTLLSPTLGLVRAA